MPHACSTLLVHCMDFRFIRDTRAWMDTHDLLGDCDVIAVPGAVKALIDPQMPEDGDVLLRTIGVAVNLHRVQRMILMNHLDCGAYGGAQAFSDAHAERMRHEGDLRKAAASIRDRFPHVTVACMLAGLRPDGSVKFEEVAPE